MPRTDPVRRVSPFYGGEFRPKSTGATIADINPTTEEVICEAPASSASDVDAAFSAAAAALPAWQALSALERARYLLRLADAIRAQSEDLGRIGTLEAGIPTAVSVAMAIRSAEFLEYFAECAETPNSKEPLPDGFTVTSHPFGIVGVLPSWNGHSGMWRKCAAAMAAGNCVVMKPSELAPLSALRYAELTVTAGMPPGVFNVALGGPRTGQLIVSHPLVGKISFTGSRRTASSVMATASKRTKPVVLELGGKSAAIIFEDADVESAARQVALGCMTLSGQGCVNPTRLLAHKSVMDDVLATVGAVVSGLCVGDPTDPTTNLGPLISRTARDRVNRQIEACRHHRWGRVVDLGRGPGPDRGFFVQPTVVIEVDMKSPIAQEEIFGPVLCVSAFDTDEQALALANQTEYGLSAYVFGTDMDRTRRIAGLLEAGCVSINQAGPMPPSVPFGGMKGSGFGREGGREGLAEFTQTCVLCEASRDGPERTDDPASWIASETRVVSAQ